MAEPFDPDSAAALMAELWAVDLGAQQRERDELDEFGDEGCGPFSGLPGSCGGCYGRGCGCGEGM